MEQTQMSSTLANAVAAEILVVPGTVKKSDSFSVNYVTETGHPVVLCKLQKCGVALTTLRSPSGTGKSTLLQKFVNYLKDNHSGTSQDLCFSISRKSGLTYSIGKVPQSPSFVKHWRVGSLLPKEGWFGKAAFGDEQWQVIFDRRMGELSGGQQRRIYASSVLERLSVEKCEQAVLIMDETLDGLGENGAGKFINDVAVTWNENVKKSLYILLVTHLSVIHTDVPEVVKASLSILSESQSSLEIKVVCEN